MNLINFHPLFINVFFHFFLILFINFQSSSSIILGNETDHSALMSLKAELTSDPLQSLFSWNESTHFCQWLGITCGKKHLRVIQINLSSKQLTGSLSPSIGNLSFLRAFFVQNNNFTGQIPSEMARLSKLRVIYLANNSFSGEIPSNISRCINLEKLDFGGNDLVGTIPIEFQSLSKLTAFRLYNNNLKGEIPDFLGNFSSLQEISISSNNFQGNIPISLGRLSALEHLQIGQNYLSGSIPPSIFNLSNLQTVNMIINELEGSLPSDLWVMLPKLRWLNIPINRFTGLIPKSISNASQLVYLDIGVNGFTGGVPNMNGLQRLEMFSIDDNLLGDGDDDDLNFLSSLSNSTKLSELYFYNNNLGGIFPKSVVNLSEMTRLSMRGNQIHGNIPKEIGELVKLEGLDMSTNKFSGRIPSSIGNLRELKKFTVYGNSLSGNIPPSLGNLTKLLGLDLSDNNLEDSIPPSLVNCVALSVLDLSQNNLSGYIPSKILSLPSFTSYIDLSNNRLVGPLVLVGQISRSLRKFDVSNNLLSGEIPSNFGGFEGLSSLSLASNLFQGSIPPTLSLLRGLEVLDLSGNNFSGKIPEYFVTFQALTTLNLSFNDFDGAVPVGGIFNHPSNFSIAGNSKICGGFHELNLPKCAIKVGVSKQSRVSRGLKYIIPTCIGIPMLILMFLAVFLNKMRHAKSLITTLGLVRDMFPQVSYRDLHRATNGFSSTNLCGLGKFSSVYKGVLDNEAIVAVKVIKLEVGGAFKSFKAECEALRRIRHRNLVKILTSCSTIDFQGNDFKALVYTFMVNGSLEGWLHHNPRSLTLLERLNIMIDVACALDYLHNHSGIPMVHCDIKPCNVLLDSDLVAHLGDFGLLKILLEAASNSASITTHTSSLGIKGTVGYVAPEYGMGSEISTCGDVYSFGILILEIFSGKSPTDDMFNEGLNLHNFVKMAIPDRVMEISYSQILPNEEELQQTHGNSQTQNNSIHDKVRECLVSMFRIGVSCSMETPRERPDISDAIIELHLIKKTLLENTILNRREGDR